uniref:HMG box domain-containing protein n=1 Tax=Panagrolaimus davidi TaxID=227884 RepID=A0A914PEN3_9BILA
MARQKQTSRMSTGGGILRRKFEEKRRVEAAKAAAAKRAEGRKAAAAAKKAKATSTGEVTKKDENAPKPAQSAYNLWYRENRETIIKEKRLKNLSKAANAAWKKLKDKSKWEEMAKEDKERYQREMNEYNGNDGKSSASAGDDQEESNAQHL